MDFAVLGVHVLWMNDKNILCLHWSHEFISFIDFFIEIASKTITVKAGSS